PPTTTIEHGYSDPEPTNQLDVGWAEHGPNPADVDQGYCLFDAVTDAELQCVEVPAVSVANHDGFYFSDVPAGTYNTSWRQTSGEYLPVNTHPCDPANDLAAGDSFADYDGEDGYGTLIAGRHYVVQ